VCEVLACVLNTNYVIQHRENIKKIKHAECPAELVARFYGLLSNGDAFCKSFRGVYVRLSIVRRIVRRCMEGKNCQRLLLRLVNVCKNIHACEQRVDLQCNDPRKRFDAIF
jgi:hypothetical protein